MCLYYRSLANETEIKLRVASAAAARRLLAQHAFTITKPRHYERNVILDTPAATLRTKGELLRLRQAAGATVITFKGPGLASAKHKTREEIETTAADFAALAAILERLGLQQGFQYEKYRTEFARPRERGHAVLDETPIGVFLELEGAPAWIDRTARRLGFHEADYILKSYGSLWAQHCAEHGIEPGRNFLFAEQKKRSRRVTSRRGTASK